jgi:hypothetical protein
MFSFNSVYPAEFKNLAEIRKERERWGGSIVLYRQAWSFFSMNGTYPELILVLPTQSRTMVGLKRSLRTFFFGWWSFGGLLATPAALAHNLCGGVDVTAIYAGPPPPVPGTHAAQELEDKLKRESQKIDALRPLFTVAGLAFAGLVVYAFFRYVVFGPDL